MKQKIALVPLAIVAALLTVSCNTVRGAGKDLNSAADTVQDEMNK